MRDLLPLSSTATTCPRSRSLTGMGTASSLSQRDLSYLQGEEERLLPLIIYVLLAPYIPLMSRPC